MFVVPFIWLFQLMYRLMWKFTERYSAYEKSIITFEFDFDLKLS